MVFKVFNIKYIFQVLYYFYCVRFFVLFLLAFAGVKLYFGWSSLFLRLAKLNFAPGFSISWGKDCCHILRLPTKSCFSIGSQDRPSVLSLAIHGLRLHFVLEPLYAALATSVSFPCPPVEGGSAAVLGVSSFY